MSKKNCAYCLNGSVLVPFILANDDTKEVYSANYCPACGRRLVRKWSGMDGDLTSRESALNDVKKSCTRCDVLWPTARCGGCTANVIFEKIKALIAADAEEVVHCKDCIHSKELPSHTRGIFVPGAMRCTLGRGTLVKGYSVIQPKGFCSGATKKMDGDADG